MELKLSKFPEKPEFNNSAGRLLSLLKMLENKGSTIDRVASFYEAENETEPEPVQETDDKAVEESISFKGQAYIHFMSLVGGTYNEFIQDIENSDKIPEATRTVLIAGIEHLTKIIYPNNPNAAKSQLQQADITLLQMAGSLLEAEAEIEVDDEQRIRDSIEQMWQVVSDSSLPKSARSALLEIIRLSRNALDQYTISGARGFRDAFKRMLGELMELYLREGDSVKDTTWWRTAYSHLVTVDAVAGRLMKYKPLLEPVTSFFLGGQLIRRAVTQTNRLDDPVTRKKHPANPDCKQTFLTTRPV